MFFGNVVHMKWCYVYVESNIYYGVWNRNVKISNVDVNNKTNKQKNDGTENANTIKTVIFLQKLQGKSIHCTLAMDELLQFILFFLGQWKRHWLYLLCCNQSDTESNSTATSWQ